jgi:hypothetical protein
MLATLACSVALFPSAALAHCDTLDGPVVVEAREALARGDVMPVLKWVRGDREPAIREAFEKTIAARRAGGVAAQVADTWFFETLVRIHREGEGAAFTGLKPAGTNPGPGIAAAEKALRAGSADELVRSLSGDLAAGVRARYASVIEKQKRAAASVEAGREYVAAYVEFLHYVERLREDLAGASHPEHAPGPAEEAEPHAH